MTLLDQLRRDEGLRLKPYRDSVGKLTIGHGRNLDDRGISEAEADMMMKNDVAEVYCALSANLPWSDNLDDARRAVLANMAYNLGIGGLLGFHKTLYFVQTGDYASAASAMLSSKWAHQVGKRATRLAAQMRSGEWQ